MSSNRPDDHALAPTPHLTWDLATRTQIASKAAVFQSHSQSPPVRWYR